MLTCEEKWVDNRKGGLLYYPSDLGNYSGGKIYMKTTKTNNNPFRIFNSGYMQCSDHGCIDGSHGTDLPIPMPMGADDDAAFADFGGCDLRAQNAARFHGRISADRFGRRSGLSNMGGGVQYLIGPTGGFLLSFPIMAYLIGLGGKEKQKGMFSLFLVPRNRGKLRSALQCIVMC